MIIHSNHDVTPRSGAEVFPAEALAGSVPGTASSLVM